MNERIEQAAEAIAENCIGKRTRNHPANQLEEIIIRDACIEMAEWLLSHQWISVDEELPEEHSVILTHHRTMNECFVLYYEDGSFSDYMPFTEGAIDYWMPIPTLEGGEK